ncbi:MAG: SCP-2 sterol transfer family protein [Methylococcales bacterium]|jgi:hypothetical protein|nr:SCP-2 sterol transfer family protein [Methylococcales bacterium]MBT7443710.1 SCP-2 sterol transfer family protein [Methylococcales bacterium]
MSELFSADWMAQYVEEWNGEADLTDALGKIGFSSVIAYGIDGEEKPRGFISVESGKAVESGSYNDQDVNWDLRASEAQWQKWMSKPPGMMGLGAAYTTRKLKFEVGDYTAMMKQPAMAGPFIKTFTIMGKV